MAMALQPSWQVQIAIFVMFGCAFYLLHGASRFTSPNSRPARARRHGGAFDVFFIGQSIGPVFYGFGFYEGG